MKRLVARLAAGSVAAVLLLGGCGDDTATDPSAADGSGSSSSESPSASVDTSEPAEPTPSESPIVPTETAEPLPDWPACTDIWVEGAKLPADYKGCLEDQTAVKAKNQYCEFGKKLVTYGDRFWAVRGGLVNDAGGPLKDSADYRDDLASCQG
ncbi:hypothetical protein [Nocardioides sp.]|uniref:hypothetical protein n=1 Tax=Nocardioides sp. TaxID=35761 RepID=UPI001A25F5B8|nr:hypothetical protein [Nocardioides sp.]MBJ7358170.1 hypothetical protein [Nocardioides sp.]